MNTENDFLTENPFAVIVRRINRIESQNEQILGYLQKFNSAGSLTSADEVLTIEQAAEFLNLTKQTVYGLVSSGKIPYSKPTGSRLYFSRLALIQWLNDNRKAPISDQAAQYETARAPRRKSANPQTRNAA